MCCYSSPKMILISIKLSKQIIFILISLSLKLIMSCVTKSPIFKNFSCNYSGSNFRLLKLQSKHIHQLQDKAPTPGNFSGEIYPTSRFRQFIVANLNDNFNFNCFQILKAFSQNWNFIPTVILINFSF